MNIRLQDLSIRIGGRDIIRQINAVIPGGTVTALIGGNGSGKSTLLKSIAGLQKNSSGTIFYDDIPLKDFSLRQLAHKRAVVFQNPAIPENMPINELMMLSRFAFTSERRYDHEAVTRALSDAGCADLAERRLGTLSGGERRKIFLALALAQEPELLLLDELEAGVDSAFLSKLPQLLADLRRERNLTILMVTHDADLAMRAADNIIGIKNGKLHSLDKNEKSLRDFTEGSLEFIAAPDGSLRAVTAFTAPRKE